MLEKIVLYATISVFAITAICFQGTLLSFMFTIKEKEELKIKSEYNDLSNYFSLNSYRYLEKISSRNKNYIYGYNVAYEYLKIANDAKKNAINSLKDKINTLDSLNVRGDYKNSYELALNLKREIENVRDELKYISEISNNSTGFAVKTLEILSEYKNFFSETVNYYENHVNSVRNDNIFYEFKNNIEEQFINIDSYIEVLDNKDKLIDQLIILQEDLNTYATLVYKTLKIMFIIKQYIPSQIQRVKGQYDTLITNGHPIDSVSVFEMISEASIILENVNEQYEDLEYYKCEENIISCLSIIDTISNILKREELASEMLHRFDTKIINNATNFIEISKSNITSLLDIENSMKKNRLLSDNISDIRNKIDYLVSYHKIFIDSFYNRTILDSEITEKIYNINNQIIDLNSKIEALISKIDNHVNVNKKISIDLANMRLIILDLMNQVKNTNNNEIQSRYTSIILSLKDELSDLENTLLYSNNFQHVKKRFVSIRSMVFSLMENLATIAAMQDISEKLIVYSNKFKNENNEIENVINAAERYFHNGTYDKSIELLITMLSKISASAKQNKISLP